MSTKILIFSAMLIMNLSNALSAQTFKISGELQDIVIDQSTGTKKISNTTKMNTTQMEAIFEKAYFFRDGVGIGFNRFGNSSSIGFGWLPIYPENRNRPVEKIGLFKVNEDGDLELKSSLPAKEINLSVRHVVDDKYTCDTYLVLNKKNIQEGKSEEKIICKSEIRLPLSHKYKNLTHSLDFREGYTDITYPRELGTDISFNEVGKEIAKRILGCKLERLDSKNEKQAVCNFNTDSLNNLLISNRIFVNNRYNDQETEIIISKFEVTTSVYNSWGGAYRHQLDLYDGNGEKVLRVFFDSEKNKLDAVNLLKNY